MPLHSLLRRCSRRPRPPIALVLVSALALALTACSDGLGAEETTTSGARSGGASSAAPDSLSPEPLTAVLNLSAEPLVVVDEAKPGGVSVGVSRALFAAAPVVVVAQTGDADGIRQAAAHATRLGMPLLLVDTPDPPAAPGSDSATATASAAPDDSLASTAPPTSLRVDVEAQRSEITRLGAQAVLAVGTTTETALGALPGVQVVTDAGELPAVSPARAAPGLTVLVRGGAEVDEPVRTVATAAAKAVGADLVAVATEDLRADPAAIAALAEQPPDRVLAVGPDFGPVDQLSGRLEVASTGVELPGGGQAIFPGRRLVALYGHPSTPGLGVLGEQDLEASIARAKEMAAQYDSLSTEPVVPAFEIIATVAHRAPGADGDYSGETAVEALRPWVEKAGEEGVYVVLDLQPGRATFLDQARIYADLLRLPHVGLALDPEWRLRPDQRPLGQIGKVEAAEVNSVIAWLADLTAEERLPQKLLVLHQFRISMLQDEHDIDLGRDQVQVLIHMDGQGSPDLKDATWAGVLGAAPEGVPFGWKNFYDEDQPMLTPAQTMSKRPVPVMISYQ